jgi:hypothetical protein
VVSGLAGGAPGLLGEVQAFLAREWPGTVFDDGYYVLRVSAPAAVSYWAPGDRHRDQLPARRQLFDLMLGGSARLWLLTLNNDAGPHVSAADRVDCRTLWATPDEYEAREHSVCAVEAATGAFDVDAIIEMAARGGADGATFIDPQRKTGFQPGTSSYPARLFACSRAELDPVIARTPTGEWF